MSDPSKARSKSSLSSASLAYSTGATGTRRTKRAQGAARATRPLTYLLLGLIPLAIGAFFLFEATTTRGARGEELPPRLTTQMEDVGARPSEQLIPAPALERIKHSGSELSTVLWPLEVELVLKEADYLPREEGMVNIGSGASARMKGRIQDRRDKGAPAKIRFLAGSNAGRVLSTDSEGYFGAVDLYPGLSIVEVTGAGLGGSRRELRLRQGQETLLHISYYRPATVVGRVQDRLGEPIVGAEIHIDGTPVHSTIDGGFSLAGVASGKVLMEVTHPDYASTQAQVWVAAAQVTPPDKLVFTLQKGCQVDIVVSNDVGGPGPVELMILPGQGRQTINPGSAYREERYPYHSLNPIRVRPGELRTIIGLPSKSLRVYAFRPGAKAIMRFVNPRPDNSKVLEIQLKPAETITGHITHNGEPAIGVPVTLEAASRVRAMLSHVNEGRRFLEIAALPSFPPARQTALTDAEGRFRFTEWEKESATRYLEARSADGSAWAGRLVHRGDRRVDLVLEDSSFGNSLLELEFPGRFQALPVDVRINGAPLDRIVLPAGEDLTISDLLAGDWSLRVSWQGQTIHEKVLSVGRQEAGAAAAYPIVLPAECIEGQDEEAWQRAGREYPLATD